MEKTLNTDKNLDIKNIGLSQKQKNSHISSLKCTSFDHISTQSNDLDDSYDY